MQKAGLIIGLLLFVFSCNVQSALSRPFTEDGKPTEVQVVGAVLDVDKINSAEQNFTLNFYAIFRWMDPRLAHAGPGSDIRDLSEVWNPRLTIINTQRYWENTRDEVEVSPEGLVTYRLHVFGDFSQPLDLHDFPQDRHVFEVPVVAAGYRPHEVVMMPDPRMDSFIAENLSVADWKVSNMQGMPREVTFANGLKLPGFVFSFEGERLLHHYVIKAITPLAFIVMMSWVVFWIDPKQVPNQLSVAVTTVLTLREQRAHHKALVCWNQERQQKTERIESRIGEHRMASQLLEDQLQSERHKLMTMNGFAKLFVAAHLPRKLTRSNRGWRLASSRSRNSCKSWVRFRAWIHRISGALR